MASLNRGSSFGSVSSAKSSTRRRSDASESQIDDIDFEGESVSEAGDIGDRAIHSISTDSVRFSIDYTLEGGAMVAPVTEEEEEEDPEKSMPNLLSLQTKVGTDSNQLPKLLEYISCLTQLAVFGILGVLTRHSLQKLFGPGIAKVTSDESILYLDLPSNMLGSFLMGWFGIVFKGDISHVSEYLAIGLTTGYLGSLTTFSGWNQKMLELSVEGHWFSSVLGFLIGLFLAAYSIIFGVETAKGFRKLLEAKMRKRHSIFSPSSVWRVDSRGRHMAILAIFMLLLALLLSLCGILLRKEFSDDNNEAPLWLGCLVGPLGVWIRWFLARLNGRGLGRSGRLKWIPFGTLIANVSASCIMAALATTRKVVNTKTCNTITTGTQLGFLGCLSTVSTFIAEFNAMRESTRPFRAYMYALLTICLSFGFGTLIFSVPVWTKAYN